MVTVYNYAAAGKSIKNTSGGAFRVVHHPTVYLPSALNRRNTFVDEISVRIAALSL